MEEETIVIKIPKIEEKEKESLKKELERIARKKINKLITLKMLQKKWEEMLKNSKITDEDCINWQKEARKGRYEELKKLGLVD